MVAVRLQNVCKSFGATRAVDDVTLTIEDGEFFFLLGPSGCGKTTLLRIVAGLCPLDSGQIHFDDRLLNDVPPHRRNTAMVFQNYALWPHLTVGQNVGYGLKERKLGRQQRQQRVQDVLKTVRMEGFEDRLPNQLSGGQQQRVAVARALVIEPDVVLFDEPLSNLDAGLRHEMRYELRRIHQATCETMIYVTHDQKEALAMADRIAVMREGCVEQVGSPTDIYARPQTRFVAGFVGDTNFIEAECERAPDAEVDNGHVRLRTPLGPLLGTATPDLGECPDTAKVVCSIRPEAIRFSCPPEGPPVNRFHVTLTHRLFLGEHEERLVEAGGLQLRTIGPAEELEGVDGGDRLEVAVRVDDVLVFKRD